MTLSWVAVNANTGQMIADFPDLELSGMFGCTLMRYESQTAALPVSSAPENWVQATRPGAVWLVCLDDDGVTPLWGGMVIDRERGDGVKVPLALATPEAYFDRRYVGDVSFSSYPQNLIVRDLVNLYAKSGGLRGIPIRVQVVGGNGVGRDRTYKDSSDKTLYSVLGEMSGLVGGPEWTVGWENVNNLITPVLYVGDRIGRSAPAGLGPAAQFDMPGSVSTVKLKESWTSALGANRVMATSSGMDDARPQSDPYSNTTDLRPTFEHRWSPSTSITQISTLNNHASRALTAMQNGGVGLEITANREESQKLGKDWSIGDDIGFDIRSPEFPNGLSGVARVVGWRMDAKTIQPLVDVTAIGGI